MYAVKLKSSQTLETQPKWLLPIRSATRIAPICKASA